MIWLSSYYSNDSNGDDDNYDVNDDDYDGNVNDDDDDCSDDSDGDGNMLTVMIMINLQPSAVCCGGI